ncbi:APC family permease [Arthrobacter sp. OAP107]|uniref:APC family permease n=1 Tax=Arthrobacter sp. OAP107 TaxID=3156445 RepID=UPI0033975C4D
MLSYLGFDAVSTFAEEAKNPRRSIPRAIMLTTVLAGLIFLGLAYISRLLLPVGTFTNTDSPAIEVVGAAGGNLLVALFTAAYIAGSLGSALTSQASVSRIIYSMGRGRVLPAVFGRLHPRLGTPVVPIIVTSGVSLLALVLDLTTVSSLISFGALVAFSVVNPSVIKHYFIDQEEARNQGHAAQSPAAGHRLCADAVALDQPKRTVVLTGPLLGSRRPRLSGLPHPRLPPPDAASAARGGLTKEANKH